MRILKFVIQWTCLDVKTWIFQNPKLKVQWSGIISTARQEHATKVLKANVSLKLVPESDVKPPRTRRRTAKLTKRRALVLRSREHLQQQLSRTNNLLLKWRKARNGSREMLEQRSSQDAGAEAWERSKKGVFRSRNESYRRLGGRIAAGREYESSNGRFSMYCSRH